MKIFLFLILTVAIITESLATFDLLLGRPNRRNWNNENLEQYDGNRRKVVPPKGSTPKLLSNIYDQQLTPSIIYYSTMFPRRIILEQKPLNYFQNINPIYLVISDPQRFRPILDLKPQTIPTPTPQSTVPTSLTTNRPAPSSPAPQPSVSTNGPTNRPEPSSPAPQPSVSTNGPTNRPEPSSPAPQPSVSTNGPTNKPAPQPSVSTNVPDYPFNLSPETTPTEIDPFDY